ncbi:hypothetical protein [Ignicoccus hospitalis]|uniref:Uncharacterized protein n=1 Tax=Ignicoccus hospitalis (strain KIN4/I / DSM 18386 / JCM 14125) TaxID=453591 RepID=A8A8G9_IGNH4|nr:hypothetical protein [Ignicoccus hospitalis]ABU81221.1 hypothetical protein Igni_0037 [Ignicoccus hospitalis KIN4/I]HIH90651.1 hypothetical protein [Desulfurococcaceae archaeon]
MGVDEYVEASERQSELLEELKKIIKSLEEAPADFELNQRIREILDELGVLRKKLLELSKLEPVGDAALLQEFYKLVGVFDERDALEELLKLALKGKVDVSPDEIASHIKEIKKFEKSLE